MKPFEEFREVFFWRILELDKNMDSVSSEHCFFIKGYKMLGKHIVMCFI